MSTPAIPPPDSDVVPDLAAWWPESAPVDIDEELGDAP